MTIEELKQEYQKVLFENDLNWWDLSFEDFVESYGKEN